MPQGKLAHVLRGVLGKEDERLLVGPQSVDDAGVVLLGDVEGMPAGGPALVQTVDYFPPVVDDPYDYGSIAAANALSDVYAMGGRPHSALNLAGFPEEFADEWIEAIFRGGFDKVREAGAIVAGGHTVRSNEALFGFAVTGLIDPARVTSNDGARVGDLLFLTKGLGMGCFTTAAKLQKIDAAALKPAAVQMARLNRGAADAMMRADAHACTDVTGFGLLGHAANIARASNVTLEFDVSELPLFPGALELGREGLFSGGARRSRATLEEAVTVEGDVPDELLGLCYDSETSGGLLICVAPEQAADLERELEDDGWFHAPVGRVTARGETELVLRGPANPV